MEETEKKKKGRPRKQVAVTENSQETSPKEVEAKLEAQALDSETPKKSHRGRPRKTKIPATEESSKGTPPEHSASENSELGTEKRKSGTGKTAVSARGKAAKPRGRKKNDTVQTVKEVPLAITSQERKAIASAAQDRKALLTGSSKELPYDEIVRNLPAEQGVKDIALVGSKDMLVYEQGQMILVEEKSENKKIAASKKRGRKSKKAAENKEIIASEVNENAKQDEKDTADFVAGVNGVAEYNGAESLSAYGEQAGLGVLGIIEEAPYIDAVLPLVSDSEKSIKKPRKRGRKKKIQSEADSVQESENFPIVEDGEIARIEAEETLRKAKKNKKETAKDKKEHVHRVLYVSTVPDEQVEVVITENGVVSEYFVEMAHQSKIRGNIYKGVINNVDTNLQAAFVNFGCGKNGFLQIDEVHPEYYLSLHHETSAKYPPIQKVLKVGQEVLVQVVKEPNGSKGAFLTTWLSLAGRFLVLTPGQEQIGVSRKVEDNEERQRLRALLNGIKPGENMGVIIRTVSEGASKTHIHKDLQLLKRTWKTIQKQVVKSPAPSLVYQEADLATRAVRDYLNEDIDEVWVDSKDVQKSVGELIKVLFPKNKEMLHLYDDKRQTLWEHFNITRQLDEVTKREVNLPSGGRLVFDQTEALMAIDINSGKSQGKSNFEAMVYRTNMEAVEAIARHLRLRDIGGQVVIDFIEMRDKNHCREVENALHAAMKRDRARHDIGKLSGFGLLELVRQRIGSSVISISSEPCPHCRGTGFRRNLEWQAQGVLRDIKSKLAGKNVPATYVHHVEQEIAFYLLNKKRDRLSELEHEFNVRIEIHLK